jgi:hypothetical protein
MHERETYRHELHFKGAWSFRGRPLHLVPPLHTRPGRRWSHHWPGKRNEHYEDGLVLEERMWNKEESIEECAAHEAEDFAYNHRR